MGLSFVIWVHIWGWHWVEAGIIHHTTNFLQSLLMCGQDQDIGATFYASQQPVV